MIIETYLTHGSRVFPSNANAGEHRRVCLLHILATVSMRWTISPSSSHTTLIGGQGEQLLVQIPQDITLEGKKQVCLPTPWRLAPLRGWANSIGYRKWREGNVTGLECAGQLMLTYSRSHLSCLVATSLNALMATIGHNVPLATDTHLVIVGSNSFPGSTRRPEEGPVCPQCSD